MGDRFHCSHCGDVIGVYEPMIMVIDDMVRETSRAAETVPHEGAALYHRDCFHERADDAS